MRIDHLRMCRLRDDLLRACSRKSGHFRIHLVEDDLLRICTMRKPRSLEDVSFERPSFEGLLQEELPLDFYFEKRLI